MHKQKYMAKLAEINRTPSPQFFKLNETTYSGEMEVSPKFKPRDTFSPTF